MLIDNAFDKYRITPNGVLHVGAHKGQEAQLYYSKGAKKTVWVEALPRIYDELVNHLRQFPDAYALKACVSDVDDSEVEFFVSSDEARNEGMSSSFLKPKTHLVAHPSVKFESSLKLRTTRLDTLLENEVIDILDGLDFLAMDLQGAELLALKGLGDLLNQFKWVYLEVNRAELYEKCAQVDEIDTYLREFNFVGLETQWTGFGWGDKLYVKQEGI